MPYTSGGGLGLVLSPKSPNYCWTPEDFLSLEDELVWRFWIRKQPWRKLLTLTAPLQASFETASHEWMPAATLSVACQCSNIFFLSRSFAFADEMPLLDRKLQLENGQVATPFKEVLLSLLWAFHLVTSYGPSAPLFFTLPPLFLALLIHSVVQDLVSPSLIHYVIPKGIKTTGCLL